MDDWILGDDALLKVKDLALFYPCSGNDLLEPIELFSPHVSEFWFVDRGYFTSGHQDTRFYGADEAADRQRPLLEHDRRYRLLDRRIEGPPDWDRRHVDIEPCVLSETYRHLESRRLITVHRRRGYGFSAFRKEIAAGRLGVFFYRRDSVGEGGSGNQWLRKEHLDEVCAKLADGGLLVIDGSDGSGYIRRTGIYKTLCKHAWKSPRLSPAEIISGLPVCPDGAGRQFRCVGYAGSGYGPTLIWQVSRPIQHSPSIGDPA